MRYAFTEDDVPIVNAQHLSDVSRFEQLYLIGKVLCESMFSKLIISKCILDWQLIGEVNIVNMGIGFSLVKFTNALDCNRVLEGQ